MSEVGMTPEDAPGGPGADRWRRRRPLRRRVWRRRGRAARRRARRRKASTTTTTDRTHDHHDDGAPPRRWRAVQPIPEETAGPFPGDGTNGPNVLTQNGVVRRDIRSSFGSASGVASGVPLTVDLTVVDTEERVQGAVGCGRLHLALRPGRPYSMYGQGVTGENYLRGVQVTDANGGVHVHQHLPGGVLRPLAAHPLRGVPEPGERDQRREQDRGLAARAPGRRLHRGVRHRRLQPERAEPRPDLTAAPTWCSPTESRSRRPTISGDTTNGYTAKLVVGV